MNKCNTPALAAKFAVGAGLAQFRGVQAAKSGVVALPRGR
jgi:hypothetical protein